MKNLIILAVFATGLLLNLQETKAQKATKAQKPNAPLTNTEVYTQNQMQFMEKNCPDCENGNYINSEGRCCCSEIDGACGKILTHDQIQFAMGIGAVDPCEDDPSNCWRYIKLKEQSIAQLKVLKTPYKTIFVTPKALIHHYLISPPIKNDFLKN